MTPRVFVFLDPLEQVHNPSHNLSYLIRCHQAAGDLRPGDLFITHPLDTQLTDSVVSTIEIKTIEPLSFVLDLAGQRHRKFRGKGWRPLKYAERI